MKAATTRLGLKTAAEKPAKVVKPIPKLPSKPVEESVPKTVPSVNNLPSAQSSGATALPSTDPVSLSGQVNPPGSQPGFTSAPTVDNKYLAALASLKDALPPALLAQVQQLVLAAQSSQQVSTFFEYSLTFLNISEPSGIPCNAFSRSILRLISPEMVSNAPKFA